MTGMLADLGIYFLVGYGLPLGVLLVVGYVVLRPARWGWLDWIAVALPGLVWSGLVFFDERARGCSSLAYEPVLLAFLVAIAAGVRSRVPTRWGAVAPALALLLAGLASCLGLYLFFPRIGE